MRGLLQFLFLFIFVNTFAQRQVEDRKNILLTTPKHPLELNQKEDLLQKPTPSNVDLPLIKPNNDSIPPVDEFEEMKTPFLVFDQNQPNIILDDQNVVATKENPVEQTGISKEKSKNLSLTPTQSDIIQTNNIVNTNYRPKIIFIKERLLILEKEIVENKDNPNYDIKAAEAELEDLRNALKL
jgi:hypothetical protein